MKNWAPPGKQTEGSCPGNLCVLTHKWRELIPARTAAGKQTGKSGLAGGSAVQTRAARAPAVPGPACPAPALRSQRSSRGGAGPRRASSLETRIQNTIDPFSTERRMLVASAEALADPGPDISATETLCPRPGGARGPELLVINEHLGNCQSAPTAEGAGTAHARPGLMVPKREFELRAGFCSFSPHSSSRFQAAGATKRETYVIERDFLLAGGGASPKEAEGGWGQGREPLGTEEQFGACTGQFLHRYLFLLWNCI